VNLQSWGGLSSEQETLVPEWRHETLPKPAADGHTLLPYGLGRSYGDSCLNEGGAALLSSHLDRLISFDAASGEVHCEAGIVLKDLIEWALPRGWFLPVSPGTQFVTVGGAIANDVHGKNHHVEGSFGAHVTSLTLLRSDGSVLECSRSQNADYFRATLGGLGLTGFIVAARFRLKKVAGPWVDQEEIKFRSLRDYFALSEESKGHNYVVSWIDCLSARPDGSLKGIFIRGDHAAERGEPVAKADARLDVPFRLPSWVLSRASIGAFNWLYFAKNTQERAQSRRPYGPFFYPLDAIGHWNRIYGKAGLLQYQCVLPFRGAHESLREMLVQIARSGQGSFLGVLKNFGDQASEGLLSFPRPGVTLALDFKNEGARSRALFERLDRLVLEADGALYPAKDQRMGPEIFRASFPFLGQFCELKDPAFSSSFWRRVCPDVH
jgi:FAD/FMN-containing dehydrogenase